MSDMNKTAREFYKTIEGAATKKQKGGYDTQATVQRIEDGVCWVHIPGGVSETPAKLTIAAKVGDVVQVRVANGRAFLVGNASAPPTDDKEAIKALTMAGSAAQAAGIAWQKAEEATADAERAHEAAMSAQDDAERAQASADAAQTSADNAQTSATTANTAANNALSGLSMVESVVDVVNWFAEHKTPSTDTTVDPTKTYYSYDATTGTLTKLDPEGTEDPSALGWYELGDAISQYVATHVATTNDGLYVLAGANGWRVLVSSGGGSYSAGVYLIDPSGNVAQQTTANGVEFNTGRPVKIGDQTAYINFDGNGHISVIGADLTIGGANNVSGVLNVKDATGATIGTWDKDGINATNANISGSVTTVSGNNKFILNTGTLSGYYANNLVGALSIARSTYDLTSVIQQLDPVIQQQIPYTSVTASVLKLASSNSVGFVTGNVGEIDLTTNNGNCGIIIKDVREYFHLTGGVDVDVARWAAPSLTFKGNSVFTDSIRIQRSTSNGVSFDTANPQIQFCNSNASQNVALVFTDFDSVQSPASLTLAGNQGGEYFIAPYVKATEGMYVGANTSGNHVHIFPRAVDAIGDGSTSAWLQAKQSTNNAIYIQAEVDGQVTLGSKGANNTYYTILKRRNNAHDIDIFGNWYVNTAFILLNNHWMYYADSSGTNRVLAGVNSNNDVFFGYGSYTGNIGNVYLDGNTVYLRSKNSIYFYGTTTAQVTSSGNFQSGASSSTGGHFFKVWNNKKQGSLYADTSGNLGIYCDTHSKWLIYINSSGTVVANTSDIRYKENVTTMPESDALSILREVDIINFSYKEDETSLMQSGVSAQQLRDVVLKHGIKEHAYITMGSTIEGDTSVYTDITMPDKDIRYEIDYGKLVPVIWKGWQYQDRRIAELESRINELERRAS